MSALDEQRLRVVPGSGVVVRVGGVTAVAFPEDDTHTSLVNDVVAAVRSAAGAPDAGRQAARAVAGLLADAPSAPALGLMGADGGGVAVLLHGDVELSYHTAAGDEHLSGADAATWLDRLVATVPDQWSLARRGAGAADEWSDLQVGVTRGDGVAAGGATASTPDPVPPTGPPAGAVPAPPAVDPAPPPPPTEVDAPPPAPDFVAVSLTEATDEPTRAPLPVAGAGPGGAAPADDEPEAPEVTGIRCSRDHLNDPKSAYCAVCGISMVQLTHAPVKGPRPALGVLVLDDGSTYVVDRDIVIGRDPRGDDDVRTGAARAVTLTDPQRAISRVHARVTLDEWDVTVVDAGSANGTFVAARDATQWSPVPAGSPVPLVAGMHLLVGQRVLSFDSHRRG